MGIMDTLGNITGDMMGGAPEPDLSPVNNSELMALMRQYMQGALPNPADDSRSALARALVAGGRAMASTPGNALAGLAGGVTAGGGAYLDDLDENKKKRYTGAAGIVDDIMKQDKQEETARYNDLKNQTQLDRISATREIADSRIALAQLLERGRDKRYSMGEQGRDARFWGGEEGKDRRQKAGFQQQFDLNDAKTKSAIETMGVRYGFDMKKLDDQQAARLAEIQSQADYALGRQNDQQAWASEEEDRKQKGRVSLQQLRQAAQRDAATLRYENPQRNYIEAEKLVAKKRTDLFKGIYPEDKEAVENAESDFQEWESNFWSHYPGAGAVGKGGKPTPEAAAPAPAAPPPAGAVGVSGTAPAGTGKPAPANWLRSMALTLKSNPEKKAEMVARFKAKGYDLPPELQ